MKASKLSLGLEVLATAIVATPAYASEELCPYVEVTMHLVDKLTGESIAEDAHLYVQSIRSTPNSDRGDACKLEELPYVAGYNAIGNGYLGIDGKTYIVDVPYNSTAVSTTIYYEKTADGGTQSSKIGWYQSNGYWHYNGSNGKLKAGWLKDGGE